MDSFDRKILGLLREDATRTYADMASHLHLSPPALHDRVKKLKARGVIKRTTVELDPQALDRNFCAFVHVETEGYAKDILKDVAEADPAVEEMHGVAGSSSAILKVRTHDAAGLEELLRRLFETGAVRRTESFVVLRTYLERGISP